MKGVVAEIVEVTTVIVGVGRVPADAVNVIPDVTVATDEESDWVI